MKIKYLPYHLNNFEATIYKSLPLAKCLKPTPPVISFEGSTCATERFLFSKESSCDHNKAWLFEGSFLEGDGVGLNLTHSFYFKKNLSNINTTLYGY